MSNVSPHLALWPHLPGAQGVKVLTPSRTGLLCPAETLGPMNCTFLQICA